MRAVQAGPKHEMPFEQGATVAEDLDHFIVF
jgi:hypothetical protein